MDIPKTKSVLIEAYDQLSSFSKSMHSLGLANDDLSFEFDWIETCIGLCEIHEKSDDEFIRSRALKKIRLFMEEEQDENAQLSFVYEKQKNSVVKSINKNNDPNVFDLTKLAEIEFEDVSF